jgi:hypothetical protein
MKWIAVALSLMCFPAFLHSQEIVPRLELSSLRSVGSDELLFFDESAIPVRRVMLSSGSGWLAGAAVGVALGYVVDRDGGDSWIGPAGPWIGGLTGAAAGSAIGANLANRRRGNPVLATVGAIGAGVAVLYVIQGPFGVIDQPIGAGVFLLGGQVATSTLVEILTSR